MRHTPRSAGSTETHRPPLQLTPTAYQRLRPDLRSPTTPATMASWISPAIFGSDCANAYGTTGTGGTAGTKRADICTVSSWQRPADARRAEIAAARADARRTFIEIELARLPPRCTRDGRRLLQVTRDFLASRWFNRAIALGWDTTELFGINVDAERPLIGDWGLLVTVALVAPPGAKIVSVSQDCACYRTQSGKMVTWPRFRPTIADNMLWWECSAIVNTDN